MSHKNQKRKAQKKKRREKAKKAKKRRLKRRQEEENKVETVKEIDLGSKPQDHSDPPSSNPQSGFKLDAFAAPLKSVAKKSDKPVGFNRSAWGLNNDA